MLALVLGCVSIILCLSFEITRIEPAVKRFDSSSPELEVACIIFRIARKCDLRSPFLQLVYNLAVGDIAHLMILLKYDAALVANATLILGHESITSLIRSANITVDALPVFRALTMVPFSWRSDLLSW